MRIIAGTLRSRQIRAPAGSDIRPTSDKLRETLFNVLAPRIESARFLDLYAGTGAVAIEALSRGARDAVLVESSKRAARTARENLEALGLSDQALLIEDDVPRALRQMEEVFDIVFLDPPYSLHGQYEASLTLLSLLPLLAPNAVVIAEHDKRHTLYESYGKLKRYRQLAQGDATLSFYAAT